MTQSNHNIWRVYVCICDWTNIIDILILRIPIDSIIADTFCFAFYTWFSEVFLRLHTDYHFVRFVYFCVCSRFERAFPEDSFIFVPQAKFTTWSVAHICFYFLFNHILNESCIESRTCDDITLICLERQYEHKIIEITDATCYNWYLFTTWSNWTTINVIS